ncbi:MAG: hypothetical protein AAFN09_16975 [Pseudomonadota bacterium]
MTTNALRLATVLFLTSAAAASAGPIATGNASGGALPIITPPPATEAPAPQAQAQAAAPAPVQSTFIQGYVASFSR